MGGIFGSLKSKEAKRRRENVDKTWLEDGENVVRTWWLVGCSRRARLLNAGVGDWGLLRGRARGDSSVEVASWGVLNTCGAGTTRHHSAHR